MLRQQVLQAQAPGAAGLGQFLPTPGALGGTPRFVQVPGCRPGVVGVAVPETVQGRVGRQRGYTRTRGRGSGTGCGEVGTGRRGGTRLCAVRDVVALDGGSARITEAFYRAVASLLPPVSKPNAASRPPPARWT
ncbi:hypothetical protein GCM10010266_65430 [Streptomyces griseomycini]|nr:hypothetical protein GCM10010266_65430 [Streptomyces griseomycini]